MDRVTRRERSRRSEGFTLIEVMIALSVLAAGLLTVAAAQLYAMRGGSSGRHTTDAAAVAHSQLENFQRMDFTDAALDDTGGDWVDGDPLAGVGIVQTEDGDLTEMAYAIQYRVDDRDDNLKAVDVRVTWDEPRRPGRSVTLSSMVHNDPQTGG
jgi:type IV pilus assembly protein PilV